MIKPILPMAFLFLMVSCGGSQQQGPPPAPALPVVKPTIQEVPVKKEFVGQVYGYFDIPIRARVEGFLEGIHFKEGNPVKKGQLLYTIDRQPFLQNVARYESNLSEAIVKKANAENDYRRIAPLAEKKAVSERDLDAAIADLEASKEAVKAAEANLNLAKIELGYTNVYAPITGLIGKTEAKEGEFVGKSPNPVILNTVSRIDSIHVKFFISEADYLKFAKETIERIRRLDSLSKLGQGFKDVAEESKPLELLLADGSVYQYTGKVDFIDREVDPNTGSILIQATFPNPDRLIRPGQFAKVRGEVQTLPEGMLIPQRCVREIQGTYFVYKVNADNLIEQQEVILGDKYKDYWIVLENLERDDRIVLEGLQRAREGVEIQPQDTVFVSNYKG